MCYVARVGIRTDTLAPGLLLASPRLGDPNFERTVVLLGKHDPEGALGWVLNGRTVSPTGELLRGSGLLPAEGASLHSDALARLARLGGPVSPNVGWVLYEPRHGMELLPGTLTLDADLAITGHAGAFERLAHLEPALDFKLLLGYAGWGPGQLESELKEGAWLPAPLVPSLLQGTSPEELWNAAYQHTLGVGPAAFTATRGSA